MLTHRPQQSVRDFKALSETRRRKKTQILNRRRPCARQSCYASVSEFSRTMCANLKHGVVLGRHFVSDLYLSLAVVSQSRQATGSQRRKQLLASPTAFLWLEKRFPENDPAEQERLPEITWLGDALFTTHP